MHTHAHAHTHTNTALPSEHDVDSTLGSTHRWGCVVEVLPVDQGEVAVDLPLHSVLLQEGLSYQAPRLRRGGARGWGMKER